LAALVCPLGAGKQDDGGGAAGVGRPPVLALPDPPGILASAGGRGLQQFAAEIADAGLDRVPVSEAIHRLLRAAFTTDDRYVAWPASAPGCSGRSSKTSPTTGRPAGPDLFQRGIDGGIFRDDLSATSS
jgi:hypothetical protein